MKIPFRMFAVVLIVLLGSVFFLSACGRNKVEIRPVDGTESQPPTAADTAAEATASSPEGEKSSEAETTAVTSPETGIPTPAETTAGGEPQAALREKVDGATMQQIALDDSLKGSVLVLDVRTPKEFAEGHLHNALNISHEQLLENPKMLINWKELPIYLYCRSGKRSGQVADALQREGFLSIHEAPGVTEYSYKLEKP